MEILRCIAVPSSMQSSASNANPEYLELIPFRRFLIASSDDSWISSIYSWTTSRPYSSIRSCMSAAPLLLAAICALMSAMLSLRVRVPWFPGILAGLVYRRYFAVTSSNRSSLTILTAFIIAPSCQSSVEFGGIDPGNIPPISA